MPCFGEKVTCEGLKNQWWCWNSWGGEKKKSGDDGQTYLQN